MTRKKTSPPTDPTVSPQDDSFSGSPPAGDSKLEGLIARGSISRRWRKTLPSGDELVYYQLADGTTLQMWRPTEYFAIGEQIEAPVTVRVFTTKHGVTYALELDSGTIDGEF